MERFCVATKQLCVTIELAKVRGNYVKTEQFYVAIELAKVGRNSVAIEDFWVATEMATIKVLYPHDRAECARQACTRG